MSHYQEMETQNDDILAAMEMARWEAVQGVEICEYCGRLPEDCRLSLQFGPDRDRCGHMGEDE